MLDDELSYAREDFKDDDIDFLNRKDFERSNLTKDADDYTEREMLRDTLIKNGWVKCQN